MFEHITPVMYLDIKGYSSTSVNLFSFVYKEGYKTPEFNYYFFDFGSVQYHTIDRFPSSDETPIELYMLSMYGSVVGPFISTSIGGRINLKNVSVYGFWSLSSTGVGFETDNGYTSLSVGFVGQTWLDAGIGFSIESTGTYLNAKVPLTLVLAIAMVTTVSPALTTAAVVITVMVVVDNFSSMYGGENYE